MKATLLPALTALALVPAVPAGLAGQQNLFPEKSIFTGIEARQYNFESGFAADHVRQVAVPIAAIVPLGQRFSFDVGTWWATTNLERGGSSESFSGFTDTQLRLAYVLGTDAVVASVMINLPTGKETTTLRKFNVSSSVSSNFLLFPVNSYGSGTSVTPGLAAATTVGDWNLGLAASVRWSDEYQPFNDSASAGIRYQPGVETRIRAGVDRLVGQSRLTVGATFSTFSNDELRGGGLGNGTFDPGNRFLVDANLVSPVGSGTVSMYAWNYYRKTSSSSDSTSSIGNREDILTLGASGSFPLGSRTRIEPLLESRFWMPDGASGRLFGVGAALRYGISPTVTLVPGVRLDIGSIRPPGSSTRYSVFGWDLSAMLRYGF